MIENSNPKNEDCVLSKWFIDLISHLCQVYGYGNVMQAASTLWRMEAVEKGYPEVGCHVPTVMPFIKEEYRQMVEDSHGVYKSHIIACKQNMNDALLKNRTERRQQDEQTDDHWQPDA